MVPVGCKDADWAAGPTDLDSDYSADDSDQGSDFLTRSSTLSSFDSTDLAMTCGGAETLPDDKLGARLWPAYVAQMLDNLTLSIMLPYVSMVAAGAPYSQTRATEHRDATDQTRAGDVVDQAAAMVNGQDIIAACTIMAALAQMCIAGVLGRMVDRLGVRTVGIISSFGSLFKVAVLYLCAQSPNFFSIQPVFAALVVAYAVGGLCGRIRISAYSMVSKRSSIAKRSRHFGMLAGFSHVGFFLGQLFNILLGEHFGKDTVRAPLALATINELMVALCVIFTFPSRVKQASQAPWSDALPWNLLKTTFCASNTLFLIGFMCLLNAICVDMQNSVFVVFARARFGLTTMQISTYFMILGLSGPFVLICLMPRLVRRCGEVFVLRLGSSTMFAAFLVLFASGMTTKGWTVYCEIPFSGLAQMCAPIFVSFASRELPIEEQGKLQGAISAVNTLGQCLGPLIARFVLHQTIHSAIPSAVYLAAACNALIFVILAWCVLPKITKRSADGKKSRTESS